MIKKMTASILFILSSSAMATDGSTTIVDSDLSSEAQVEVAKAVQATCGYMSKLTQIAPTTYKGDFQEVGDIFLKTTLSGEQRSEKNKFNEYVISVDAVVPAVPHLPDTLQVQGVRCEIK